MILRYFFYSILSLTCFISSANKITVRTVFWSDYNQNPLYPIFSMNNPLDAYLHFDILNASDASLGYSIVRCDKQWNIETIDDFFFIDVINQFQVDDWQWSQNTSIQYKHYVINILPRLSELKVSGNYLLKIYLEEDDSKPILLVRFIVYQEEIKINGKIEQSLIFEKKNHIQNIHARVSWHSSDILSQYIKLDIYQNFIFDTQKSYSHPTYENYNELIFKFQEAVSYFGLNEFRQFDSRNTIYPLYNQTLKVWKQLHLLEMYPNKANETSQYLYTHQDNNGFFYVANKDNRVNFNFESEYLYVGLKLAEPFDTNKKIYVVGGFNQWQILDSYKMYWNRDSGFYEAKLLVKQGVYDYSYAIVNNRSSELSWEHYMSPFLKSYFQTTNVYQLFAYYDSPFEESYRILGFNTVNYYKE